MAKAKATAEAVYVSPELNSGHPFEVPDLPGSPSLHAAVQLVEPMALSKPEPTAHSKSQLTDLAARIPSNRELVAHSGERSSTPTRFCSTGEVLPPPRVESPTRMMQHSNSLPPIVTAHGAQRPSRIVSQSLELPANQAGNHAASPTGTACSPGQSHGQLGSEAPHARASVTNTAAAQGELVHDGASPSRTNGQVASPGHAHGKSAWGAGTEGQGQAQAQSPTACSNARSTEHSQAGNAGTQQHQPVMDKNDSKGPRVIVPEFRMSISTIPTPFERAGTGTLTQIVDVYDGRQPKSITSSCGRVEEGDEEEEDTDGSRGGRSLGTKSSPSQSRQSSVSTRMLWKRAVKSVGTMSNVARQFRTLRDMQMPHQIPRESLKVIRVLGKGAFAIVEECVYRPRGGRAQLVAVKRLKPELTRSSVDVAGMVKEAALLRKLRNSHIVEFLGFGHWDFASHGGNRQASIFIVEELVDGGSLKLIVHKQMKDKSTRLYRTADAVRWLLQVAQGLKYLHRAQPQVIHRDLKLDNILLKGRDLHTAEAKLADFGLSALVRASTAFKNLHKNDEGERGQHRKPPRARRESATDLEHVWATTAARRGSALAAEAELKLDVATGYDQLSGRTGTLMYMAPEVYRQEAYNEKADVYSFAIIGYELLHRYMMISATDGSVEECQAYARRAARGFRPPIDSKFPTPVRDFLNACWAHNPADRPSMEGVVKMLHALPKQCDLDKVDVELLGSQVLLKEVVGAQGKVAQQQRPIKPTCCPCTIQ